MSPPRSNASQGMEETLKKAVMEMLVLLVLNEQDMHSTQIIQTLESRSENRLNLTFPYALLYRLIDNGQICEAWKRLRTA